MAESSTSATVDKRQLKHVVMYCDHIRSGTEVTFSSFTWKVERFFSLRDNVEYGKQVEDLATLVFVKRRKSINLRLLTKSSYSDLRVCIKYDDHHCSEFVHAYEVEEGEYKMEFKNAIKLIENDLLRKGTMVFQFRFDGRLGIRKKPYPCSGFLDVTDDLELTSAVINAYGTDLFTDFLVRVADWDFRVHKALLAARSEYFRDQFCRDKDVAGMDLDVSFLSFRGLVCYLYFGRVLNTDVKVVIPLLELAARLEVRGLKTLCAILLEHRLSGDNVNDIKEVAQKTGLATLEESADKYRGMHKIG